MSKRKELEDFQLDMVERFLAEAIPDLEDMRRVIKNLKLFEENTPARLVARTLLVQELASLQADLAIILGGLVKSNTQDTVNLVGDQKVKVESDELVQAFRSGTVSSVKKPEIN